MPNNEIYWQRHETAATISQLNPDISEVRITTTVTGKEPVSITLTPDSKYMKRFDSPVIDCSSGYIDLSDEIFSAVKSGKVSEGKKKCGGHLKKYAHNPSPAYDCETCVMYKIEPILKKNTN
jgi:hypothetical protein